MAVIGKFTEMLQERLGVEGTSLNRRKSQTLLTDGIGPEHLTEEQLTMMDDTGLTVARQLGDEGVGSTRLNITFQVGFLVGGGSWRAS